MLFDSEFKYRKGTILDGKFYLNAQVKPFIIYRTSDTFSELDGPNPCCTTEKTYPATTAPMTSMISAKINQVMRSCFNSVEHSEK
jgi:hypothetical protein